MTNKQFEELGKGSINLGNLIGGFSIINGIFGTHLNIPKEVAVFLLPYIFMSLYIAGILLIGLSEDKKDK